MIDWSQLARFPSATIADALDNCGLYDQAMAPELRVLVPPRAGRLVGPAQLIGFLPRPRDQRDHRIQPEKSLEFQRRLESYVSRGSVVVLASHGPILPCELVGGFMAAAIRRQGGVGIVADGYVRDVAEIEALDLPTIGRGCHPSIKRGRVRGFTMGEAMQVAGVMVSDGDLIVADAEGTLVVPPAHVESVVAFCERHAQLSKQAWEDVRNGDLLSEVWERYHVP